MYSPFLSTVGPILIIKLRVSGALLLPTIQVWFYDIFNLIWQNGTHKILIGLSDCFYELSLCTWVWG